MNWLVEWSYAIGTIVAACIAGGFSIYIAHVTRQTRNQVTPSNGTKTAVMIEEIRDEMVRATLTLAEHMAQDAAFQARVEPYLKGQP